MLHDSMDMTFVVQGPVTQFTGECIRSIRDHFPGKACFLSTWKHEDCGNLDPDTIILSTDPGGWVYDEGYHCNLNRQLISTQAGLRLVTTPIVVRLRSDIVFLNNNLQNILDTTWIKDMPHDWDLVDARKVIFNNQIIVPSTYTHHPYRSTRPFSISDWMAIGWTGDVRMLFDAKPMSDEDGHWLQSHGSNDNRDPYPMRYYPEQYFPLEALRRYGDLPSGFMPTGQTSDKTVHDVYKEVLVDNFHVMDLSQLGVINKKFPRAELQMQGLCMTNDEWHTARLEVIAKRSRNEYSYTTGW